MDAAPGHLGGPQGVVLSPGVRGGSGARPLLTCGALLALAPMASWCHGPLKAPAGLPSCPAALGRAGPRG
eukprot:461931-Lingulodinium_polyedra.AAC.1